MMAVRTADKLLKVKVFFACVVFPIGPISFFFLRYIHWNSQLTTSYVALNWLNYILFRKILQHLAAMSCITSGVLVFGPKRAFNHILNTFCVLKSFDPSVSDGACCCFLLNTVCELCFHRTSSPRGVPLSTAYWRIVF